MATSDIPWWLAFVSGKKIVMGVREREVRYDLVK